MNTNILDVLLDEENKEPVVLVDALGQKIAFEQIAVIPYDEKLYCILKPLERIGYVADDEAMVFYVDENQAPPTLIVELDELKAISVFDEYYNLLE